MAGQRYKISLGVKKYFTSECNGQAQYFFNNEKKYQTVSLLLQKAQFIMYP